MALVNLNPTILKAETKTVMSLHGGYARYSNVVAKDSVAAILRVMIARADNHVILGRTTSNSDGEFEFNNLAPVKHVLTAQDPAGVKLARATTIMPIIPIIPPDDDGGEIGGGIG